MTRPHMTPGPPCLHPPEAVEAVAQALCNAAALMVDWDLAKEPYRNRWRAAAIALLDLIAPMLIAEATRRASISNDLMDASLASETDGLYAAAIRQRGNE